MNYEIVKLKTPIVIDGVETPEVRVNEPRFGDYRRLQEEFEYVDWDNYKVQGRFFSFLTGLTDADIDKLTKSDVNKIDKAIDRFLEVTEESST